MEGKGRGKGKIIICGLVLLHVLLHNTFTVPILGRGTLFMGCMCSWWFIPLPLILVAWDRKVSSRSYCAAWNMVQLKPTATVSWLCAGVIKVTKQLICAYVCQVDLCAACFSFHVFIDASNDWFAFSTCEMTIKIICSIQCNRNLCLNQVTTKIPTWLRI